MKTESRDLSRSALADRLHAEYDEPPAGLRLTFVPKGEEAYAYLAETPSSGEKRRWFVKVHPVVDEAATACLDAALRAAAALHTRGGLSQIVAPVPTWRGDPLFRWNGYAVAVFLFLENTASCWETPFTNVDRAAASRLVARLHQSDVRLVAGFALPRESFALSHRDLLRRVLDSAVSEQTPALSDYAERARALLRCGASDLRATLDRFDFLRPRLLARCPDFVVTHGDPNRANLLRDRCGDLHLVDWGALGFGPRERDLFHFTGEGFGEFLAGYVRALGGDAPRLSADVFGFYMYQWAVQEIAEYGARLLFGHNEGREDRENWADLTDYLPLRHQEIAGGVHEIQQTLAEIYGREQNATENISPHV